MAGPGFFLTFLYYFATTIVITLFVTNGAMGWSYSNPITYQVASLFGLVAGIFGAINNRTVSLTVNFKQKKSFKKDLDQKLADLGYIRQTETNDSIMYQKSAFQTWFSGVVTVKIEQQQATIIGRNRNLIKLSRSI